MITGVTAPVALPLLVPLQLVWSLEGAITHVTRQLLLIWGPGARGGEEFLQYSEASPTQTLGQSDPQKIPSTLGVLESV